MSLSDDRLDGSAAPTMREAAQHKWSIVIPTLNEAGFLPRTMTEIRRSIPPGIDFEIVVVDHGSTDHTPDIARSHGATVLVAPGVSLGALRNRGAKAATGDTLVYIDADISLTPEWGRNVRASVGRMRSAAKGMLTGSMALPDPEGSWVGRVWEAERPNSGAVKSLSGGHLIIGKAFFDQIGGFPDDVDAGEDEELSKRVRHAGGTVFADPSLKVVHRGAPRSLRAFVHRQFWHGLGDAKSLERVLGSRMALVSGGFLVLQLILLVHAVRGSLLTTGMGIGALLLSAAIPAAASFRRLGALTDPRILPLSVLFWLCFLARGMALVIRPFGLQRRRHRFGVGATS